MDLSSLTGMFVGLHSVLAMQTNTPELAITEQEGKDFTKAAQNVMRHYSVQTTQKTLDWISFLGVTVGMYGTRAFAISSRRKAEGPSRNEKAQVLKFKPRDHLREVEPAPADQPVYTPSVPPGDDTDYSTF